MPNEHRVRRVLFRFAEPNVLPYVITTWSAFLSQEFSLEIVKDCAWDSWTVWPCPTGAGGIMTAAQALGSEQLLSEDMHRGRRIGSLTIIASFR